jgi:hypothetical protein
MNQIDITNITLSCIAINETRSEKTKEGDEIYTAAAMVVKRIFSSLDTIHDILEAELIYLENESTFCHPEDAKGFANAIKSYHYALDILKVITTEPEMYRKYCVPACLSVKTNDTNGVPKDALRNALASHATRLKNNKQHTTPAIEREIYNLRLQNVTKALHAYKELQTQVLGL